MNYLATKLSSIFTELANEIRRKSRIDDAMRLYNMRYNLSLIQTFPTAGEIEYMDTTCSVVSGFNEVSWMSITKCSFPQATLIDSYAFYKCSNLRSISAPNCITINNYAFANDYNVSIFAFPECQYIENYAFAGTGAVPISFPKCINIGEGAFRYKSFSTEVNFPSVTNIGASAFQGCKFSYSLSSFEYITESGSTKVDRTYEQVISFPNCLTIGAYAFSSCEEIVQPYFPKCTLIGSYAFAHLSRPLTGGTYHNPTPYIFPKVTRIEEGAFYQSPTKDQYTPMELAFPRCHHVGKSAFAACKLSYISLPDCQYIGPRAFAYCRSLTTITLPDCSLIGEYAFLCGDLMSISANALILGSHAFESCTDLRTVSLPVLESVPAYAFYRCGSYSQVDYHVWHFRGLTSIVLGESCTYIGDSAFAYCYGLGNLTLLASSVVSVGSFPFENTQFELHSIPGIEICVPASLYNDYINNSFWQTYSTLIKSIT